MHRLGGGHAVLRVLLHELAAEVLGCIRDVVPGAGRGELERVVADPALLLVAVLVRVRVRVRARVRVRIRVRVRVRVLTLTLTLTRRSWWWKGRVPERSM